MIEKLKSVFRRGRTEKTENKLFPYLDVMTDMEEYDFLWLLEMIAFNNKAPSKIILDDSLIPTIIQFKKLLDEGERRYHEYNIRNKIGDKHGRIYIERRRI